VHVKLNKVVVLSEYVLFTKTQRDTIRRENPKLPTSHFPPLVGQELFGEASKCMGASTAII